MVPGFANILIPDNLVSERFASHPDHPDHPHLTWKDHFRAAFPA
jgi:hypothetical protein